ncbi:MAG: hypothetical protein ABSC22_04070 [Roseiarcus sp.]|jgi:hypothetical protein
MRGWAKIAKAVAIAAISAATAPALADGPTTAKFAHDCKSQSAGCKELLAEVTLDSDASCAPSLGAALAEIARHPEWSKLPWSDGVEAAIKNICAGQ